METAHIFKGAKFGDWFDTEEGRAVYVKYFKTPSGNAYTLKVKDFDGSRYRVTTVSPDGKPLEANGIGLPYPSGKKVEVFGRCAAGIGEYEKVPFANFDGAEFGDRFVDASGCEAYYMGSRAGAYGVLHDFIEKDGRALGGGYVYNTVNADGHHGIDSNPADIRYRYVKRSDVGSNLYDIGLLMKYASMFKRSRLRVYELEFPAVDEYNALVDSEVDGSERDKTWYDDQKMRPADRRGIVMLFKYRDYCKENLVQNDLWDLYQGLLAMCHSIEGERISGVDYSWYDNQRDDCLAGISFATPCMVKWNLMKDWKSTPYVKSYAIRISLADDLRNAFNERLKEVVSSGNTDSLPNDTFIGLY